MDWFDEAQCRGADPDLFFPTGSPGPKFKNGPSRSAEAEQQEAAKKCRGCPVTTQCLEYALQNDLREGVWGGTTELERKRIRKRRARRVSIVA